MRLWVKGHVKCGEGKGAVSKNIGFVLLQPEEDKIKDEKYVREGGEKHKFSDRKM